MLVEVLVLFVFYNSAVGKGADAVARGEILWQKQEKGQNLSASEKAICFHPLKGYLTALLGTLPLLICAVLLAILAHRQTTGAGTLPAWLSNYQRRKRSAARWSPIPRARAWGWRISFGLHRPGGDHALGIHGWGGKPGRNAAAGAAEPPACAAARRGLRHRVSAGPEERTKIHTGIAESNRRRIRRERKARKARLAPKRKTPEQLN